MKKKAIILLFILVLSFQFKLLAQQPVMDLREYLGTMDFTVIGNVIEIQLDKSVYPLSSQSFIVLDYMLDEKHVSKKIGFKGQSIVIEKDKLFFVDSVIYEGKTLPQVKVYYHNQTALQTDFITRINLNFLDAGKLLREFSVIRDILRKNDKSTIN